MARALDAGSGDAFTGRTSELRGKEKGPQPDRVGFRHSAHALLAASVPSTSPIRIPYPSAVLELLFSSTRYGPVQLADGPGLIELQAD